jgi:hypothetical protein
MHMASMDDDAPVTMGLFKMEIGAIKGDMDGMKAKMNSMEGKMNSMEVKLDAVILRLDSARIGIELTGPVIPPADVVVENNSFFAHVSSAVRRHKGSKPVVIISRFRNSKKYK